QHERKPLLNRGEAEGGGPLVEGRELVSPPGAEEDHRIRRKAATKHLHLGRNGPDEPQLRAGEAQLVERLEEVVAALLEVDPSTMHQAEDSVVGSLDRREALERCAVGETEELRGGYTLPNEAPSSELARYSNEIRFSVFGQFLLDDARVRNSGPQS